MWVHVEVVVVVVVIEAVWRWWWRVSVVTMRSDRKQT